MCHSALRVYLGHTLKGLLRGGIGEGVKQSYASIELLLNGRDAGDGK